MPSLLRLLSTEAVPLLKENSLAVDFKAYCDKLPDDKEEKQDNDTEEFLALVEECEKLNEEQAALDGKIAQMEAIIEDLRKKARQSSLDSDLQLHSRLSSWECGEGEEEEEESDEEENDEEKNYSSVLSRTVIRGIVSSSDDTHDLAKCEQEKDALILKQSKNQQRLEEYIPQRQKELCGHYSLQQAKTHIETVKKFSQSKDEKEKFEQLSKKLKDKLTNIKLDEIADTFDAHWKSVCQSGLDHFMLQATQFQPNSLAARILDFVKQHELTNEAAISEFIKRELNVFAQALKRIYDVLFKHESGSWLRCRRFSFIYKVERLLPDNPEEFISKFLEDINKQKRMCRSARALDFAKSHYSRLESFTSNSYDLSSDTALVQTLHRTSFKSAWFRRAKITGATCFFTSKCCFFSLSKKIGDGPTDWSAEKINQRKMNDPNGRTRTGQIIKGLQLGR